MEITLMGNIAGDKHSYYTVFENEVSAVVRDDDTIQWLLDKLASKQRELNRTKPEVAKCEQ